MASTQEKNLCFKILKKSHPDLHSSILYEVQKGYSDQRLCRVAEIKEMFDKNGLHDRRLFIAVIIKVFHPHLYDNDNKEVSLIYGLNLEISKQLNMAPGNALTLTRQVRTWLKFDVCDLRKKADEFFAQNLRSEKE